MTTGVAAPSEADRRELLPAGRRFVALPSRRRPVVLAEDVPALRRYVRTALLANPPRSAVPDWVYAAARQALRVPALWRLAPHLTGGSEGSPASDLAGLVAASGTRLLVLDHSHDPDAGVVLLLFAPDQDWPVLAAKVPFGPASADRVLAEADRLHAAAAANLGRLRRTVPAVVAVLRHDDRPMLVTTAQPGTPMLVDYHRPGHTAHAHLVLADLAAAGTWLAELQTSTAGRPVPVDLPAELDAALADRLPTATAVRDRLRRYRANATVVHGDFWPGNLLLRASRISGVVDWERAQPAGSPVRDLARFALAYSQYLADHARPGHPVPGHPGLTGGGRTAALRYALDGTGWYPRLIRRFLTEGLTRLGLPGSLGRDAVLAELAALAAEATDERFAAEQVDAFLSLAQGES